MASEKIFTNNTPHDLQVKLRVRRGEDPRETAENLDFPLRAQQSQWIRYGNEIDIYLNGIHAEASLADGSVIELNELVTQRGSRLDDQLNTNDAIDFTFDSGQLKLSARRA